MRSRQVDRNKRDRMLLVLPDVDVERKIYHDTTLHANPRHLVGRLDLAVVPPQHSRQQIRLLPARSDYLPVGAWLRSMSAIV